MSVLLPKRTNLSDWFPVPCTCALCLVSSVAGLARLPIAEFYRLRQNGGVLLHYRGLNIQQPWAGLILQGIKTIEARRYALKNYENETLWIIETPEKVSFARLSNDQLALVFGEATPVNFIQQRRMPRRGVPVPTRQAKIVGTVLFAGCFEYMDYEQWRADAHRHRIPAGSDFDWNPNAGPMYGWLVENARALIEPQPAPVKRGMIGSAAVTRMANFDALTCPSHDFSKEKRQPSYKLAVGPQAFGMWIGVTTNGSVGWA